MPDSPSIWEPWSPQVGQRVRIRLNRECRLQMTGHGAWANGLVGVVEAVIHPEGDSITSEPGHRFLVVYAQEQIVDGRPLGGSRYAAVELEPIKEGE
jgi:hypothetical protein